MEKPLILALDIGSSSVRASLYDGRAHAVPQTSVKIDRHFTATADGGSELVATEAFSQVVSAIDAVLEKSKKIKGEIEYVASCSFWHSLLPVDAGGNPTPVVLGWADTRSREFALVLRKKLNENKIHDRTGAHFHSSYWPAKLLWLRTEFPEAYASAARLLSFSDLVALKLFDEPVTSISMASGTGLFDIRQCVWDAELLALLKIKPSMMPVIAPDSATFCLNKTFAKRWPRLARAKWFTTIGDGAADNLGAGCASPSKAALMVGTSGAMRVTYTGEPPKRVPDGLWCYRVDCTRVIIGGALSDGGNLYGWIKNNLQLAKNAEDEIRQRGAVAHGLTFLPFLAGERSTGYNEAATGGVLGLTSATDATDILQAALESVAYRFAEILDRLSKVVKVKEIVASGGALRASPVWTQIIADVLGRDLLISEAQESSSRGAVLLALESIGKIGDIGDLNIPAISTVEFHPECHTAYKPARRKHRRFYEQLI